MGGDKNSARARSIAYYSLGLKQFCRKEYGTAIENLQKALRLCDVFMREPIRQYLMESHLSIGMKNFYEKKYSDAIREFDILECKFKNCMDARTQYFFYLNRGLAYLYKQQHLSAIYSFQNALRLNSNSEFIKDRIEIAKKMFESFKLQHSNTHFHRIL